MTRFSSHYADRLKGTIERVFTVLSDLRANRCEELNNYSGRMTRTKYDACDVSMPKPAWVLSAGLLLDAAFSPRLAAARNC
jgi:hypothetical protein